MTKAKVKFCKMVFTLLPAANTPHLDMKQDRDPQRFYTEQH